MLKPLAEKKRLKVIVEKPKKLEIASDRDMVVEAFTNLFENAIKYTASGEILIKAMKKDSDVEISVKDTGTGLTKDQLEKLFTRFYKVDASVPGTGLGLSIAKENIKLLGGEITAKSKGLGKGSIFTMTLPANRTDAS